MENLITMERVRTILKIARLVCKKRLFGLNTTEEGQLSSALDQVLPEGNLPILSENISLASLEKRYATVNTEEEWRVFQRQHHRKRHIRIWTVAASVCFLLAGTIAIWLGRPMASTMTLAKADSKECVSLILSTGQRINLSDTCARSILDPGTTLLANSLAYHSDTMANELIYNTLVVPKGSYYHLILSDSTKVWLNADSKLYYPVHFGKNKREVSLKGEAYFEVAKDSTRPFIVSTEAIDIKVLGTCFNVNSYQDDGRVYTALVEGQVEVSSESECRVLRPGQMASMDTRKSVPTIEVDSCDTTILTAWKEGLFRFRNTSLTQILRQISRCYDVTVILERDYEEEYYSGDISYHVSLPALLQAIEASTAVRFDIKGNTVFMRKK